jgi:hypothetical protein
MAKAHIEDIAVAASSMDLTAPSGPEARMHIAADLAALLTLMLQSPD